MNLLTGFERDNNLDVVQENASRFTSIETDYIGAPVGNKTNTVKMYLMISFFGFTIPIELQMGDNGTQNHFPDLVQIGVIHIRKCIQSIGSSDTFPLR